MKKHCTLVLFSGGLDSTACLFKLLEQTEDEVHAFYVNLTNNKNKSWCEQRSIDHILESAKQHFREVEYSTAESSITGSANYGLSQPPIWMLHAAFKLSGIDTKLHKRLCVGYTRGDCAIKEISEIREIWENVWTMINTKEKVPDIYLPIMNSTKRNSVTFLKRLERENKKLKILSKLWVCEEPRLCTSSSMMGYKPCGKCLPCFKANKLK